MRVLYADNLLSYKISFGLKWTSVGVLQWAPGITLIRVWGKANSADKHTELHHNLFDPEVVLLNSSCWSPPTPHAVCACGPWDLTSSPHVISCKVSFKGSVEMKHLDPLWSAEAFESFSDAGRVFKLLCLAAGSLWTDRVHSGGWQGIIGTVYIVRLEWKSYLKLCLWQNQCGSQLVYSD